MKKTSLLMLVGLAVSTILIYQNCGKGFKAANQLPVGSISSSSTAAIDPDALVIYDSSISSPASELMIFDPTGVTYMENKISDQNVTVQNMGAACPFAELISKGTRDWPADCWWALQAFYSARKAYAFFMNVGVLMPSKITINTQNKQASCIGHAKGTSVDMCYFSEENVRYFLPDIAPVIFREVAHIAQGSKATPFLDEARMAGFHEDHASLYAYMLSGRTTFMGSDGDLKLSVFDPSALFGWKGAGGVGSYLALTSFLIHSHRVLLDGVTKEKYGAVNIEISRLWYTMLSTTTVTDSMQVVVARYVVEFDKLLQKFAPTIREKSLADFQASLTGRNLDMTSATQSGYSISLISQALPADVGGTWKLKQLLPADLLHPIIKLSGIRANAAVESLLPLKFIVAPKNYGDSINACLKVITSDPKFAYRDCVLRSAGTGFNLTNGAVKEFSFDFRAAGDTFSVGFTPSADCTGTDFAFGKVFDAKGNDLMSFPVFFGCGQ